MIIIKMTADIIKHFLPKYSNVHSLEGNKKIFNNYIQSNNFNNTIFRKIILS